MCGAGSLLPGGAAQRSRLASLSVEALDDVEVVAFRVRDYLGAVETIRPLRAMALGRR